MSLSASTCGDLGDATYLLNIIRQIPDGPHTLCLRPSEATKAKGPDGVRRLHDAIAPLALAQDYIKDVKIIGQTDSVDWASEGFRMASYVHGQTLMQAHLNHLIANKGIGRNFTSHEPWLKVKPSPKTSGRIVINRTARYRNDWFQWGIIVEHYRHRLLFVGLEHEWREFIGHHGYVEFAPTKNMLEVAELIAGSELFIGNQSCANACAEGLKHTIIQETSLRFPDCIFKRDNAQFCVDGAALLPNVDGSGDFKIHSRAINWQMFDLNLVPRCGPSKHGWFVKDGDVELGSSILRRTAKMLNKRHPEWTEDECKAAVVGYTVSLNEDFWRGKVNMSAFQACKRSLTVAGIESNSVLDIQKAKLSDLL